jgi:protein-disulfide isomerase
LLLEQIKYDYNEGIQIGINSVPSVFVNGRKLKDRSLKGFQTLIDKELEILGQKK